MQFLSEYVPSGGETALKRLSITHFLLYTLTFLHIKKPDQPLVDLSIASTSCMCVL